MGNDKCVSCETLNPALDFFDPTNNTCVSSTGCSIGTFPEQSNKFCNKNCKDISKLKLHGECVAGSYCDSDLNATNGPTYATDNNCVCTGKKYFPTGIISYSPITKPSSPTCVTTCSEYYLTFIENDLGFDDKCVSCATVNPTLDLFNPTTNLCVSSTGCSPGRSPDNDKKYCYNCKDISKLLLHGECLVGISCNDDLNASNGDTFATDNSCKCTGKKYFPNGISAYSPKMFPSSPKCVTNCSDYYLSFIVNDQGFGNDKCASCEDIDPNLNYFDTFTKKCVSITGCSFGYSADISKKICIEQNEYEEAPCLYRSNIDNTKCEDCKVSCLAQGTCCLYGISSALGNYCTPQTCQNSGICLVNSSNQIYCSCTPSWTGKQCEIEIQQVNELMAKLDSLDPTVPLSNSALSSFISYNSLIKSNSTLITPDLVSKISTLIADQLDLLSNNLTTTSPYFVELLDLQLYLSK